MDGTTRGLLACRLRRALWLVALSFAAYPLGCGSSEDEGCTTGDACAGDDDCPDGSRCSEEQCTKLFCLADGETCSIDEVCEARECVETGDILSNEPSVCWAALRKLEMECETDQDCEPQLRCNQSLFRCLERGDDGTPCRVHEDCRVYCRSACAFSEGVCGDRPGPDEGCCETEDCTAPLICRIPVSTITCRDLSPRCSPPSNVGENCCEDADCTLGLTCQLQFGTTFACTPR